MVEQEVNTGMHWTAIALTHVEYQKGDAVGYILAWCSLFPIFICIVFGTVIVFRRDLFTMSYFAGLLLNEGINWLLKHFIKELRPLRSREVVATVYGMPSSHAQFVSFFAAFLVLFLFIRICDQCWWKYPTMLIGVGIASLVAYSRVYLMYHTASQVLVGCTVGSVLGVAWFLFIHHICTPVFPVVVSWKVCQCLMIRDSTNISNVLQFEYFSHQAEVERRRLWKSFNCSKLQ